jgi:sn-glycerol 3-phosphate transport system permease protein
MNTRAVHAYLLLLPALVLLVAFTHWPALATVIDSFLSNPKPNRPRCGWGWRTTR